MKHGHVSERQMTKMASQDAAIAPFAIALILLALVAAVRLPFLSNILLGEEGSHAYLVLGPQPVIRGLDALFIGRLNGEDYLVFPEHNILIYDFFDKFGRRIGQLIPPCRNSSIECVSSLSRTPYLVIFLIAIVIAILPLRRWLAVRRPAILAVQFLLLLFVLTTPLLVGGSIQPQIDGAYGVLVVSVSAACMLAAQTMRRSAHFLLLFLGGVVSSLGKIEWAMALAGALSVTSALAVALSYDAKQGRLEYCAARPLLDVCAGTLAGMLFGQLLVLFYSPTAYLAGFDLMRQIGGMQLGVAEGLKRSWPLAYSALVMIGATLVLIAIRLKYSIRTDPTITVIAGWAAAIAAGYAYSGWSGDGFPRYYCPAALLAAIALICLLRDVTLSKAQSVFAVAVLAAFIGLNGASLVQSYRQGLSISSLPGASLEQARTRYLKLAQDYRGVPVLEASAFAIYFPNIDWVSIDMGRQAGIEFVEAHRPEVQAEFKASIR